VSTVTLFNWANDGMPKLSRGKFDVRACVAWLIGRKESEHQAKLNNLSLDEAERRFRNAKAELAEMVFAERRGELVEADAVREMWDKHISAAKTQLLSIPARVAVTLLACKTAEEVHAALETNIRDCLDELAGRGTVDADRVDGRTQEGSSPHVGDAKKAEPKRVGRPKAVHQPRGKPDRTRKVANVKG
jgi:phage terminase Nu1 subunit (DNA packaging protein)